MNDTKQKTQTLDLDYAGMAAEAIFDKLNTSPKGLKNKRRKSASSNTGLSEAAPEKKSIILFQILSKFASPLVVVLLIIAGFSLFFGETISAVLVMLMAIMSVALSSRNTREQGSRKTQRNGADHLHRLPGRQTDGIAHKGNRAG